ncbi:MAG: hypothetical protein Kow0098_25760 [Ignavibacteriaceae bacterium]
MSPRSAEQFELIREKSKKKIIRVALRLFAHNGYHATSVSMIAAKAKISKGLLYNYFNSKEDLLIEISEMIMNELADLIKNVSAEKDSEKKIEKIIRGSVEHLKENSSTWRFYLLLLQQGDAAKKMKPVLSRFREEAVKNISGIFEELKYPEPLMEAFALGIELDGIGINYLAAPENFPLNEIVNHLINRHKKINKGK